jgi:hypothetical protein
VDPNTSSPSKWGIDVYEKPKRIWQLLLPFVKDRQIGKPYAMTTHPYLVQS